MRFVSVPPLIVPGGLQFGRGKAQELQPDAAGALPRMTLMRAHDCRWRNSNRRRARWISRRLYAVAR
jgi:hypothetical protein